MDEFVEIKKRDLIDTYIQSFPKIGFLLPLLNAHYTIDLVNWNSIT